MKRFIAICTSAAALALSLTACQPVRPSAEDAAAAELRAAGYNLAPVVTSVTQDKDEFTVQGQATGGGRVRLIYSGTNTAGQSVKSYIGGEADKSGLFRVAEVPIGVNGGLYDLEADQGRSSDNDVGGRIMHAEGRLFVPRGQPGKATMLRPGAAGRSLSQQEQIIAVADYDSTGGIAVAGQVAPDATVDLVVAETVIGRSQSDARGHYQVTGQITPPGDTETALAIEIRTDKQTQTRLVPLSRPPSGDRITAIDGGWRVDWLLPGGGMQTTVVY